MKRLSGYAPSELCSYASHKSGQFLIQVKLFSNIRVVSFLYKSGQYFI